LSVLTVPCRNSPALCQLLDCQGVETIRQYGQAQGGRDGGYFDQTGTSNAAVAVGGIFGSAIVVVLPGDRAGAQRAAAARGAGAGDGMIAAAAGRERDWLIPSAVMTAGLGVAALLLMPVAGYHQIPNYFDRFLNWMNYIMIGGLLLLMWQVLKLYRTGVERPLAELKGRFLEAWTVLLSAIAGAMLAGVDMLFFMWIKPELTAVSPFWADRLFADVDHAIFRVDPWRLFVGLDLTFHGWAYSFFWLAAIIGTVVWLLAQGKSIERSASLISYFAIWSIFGTVGQLLLSSAGPIFYQRIGLGDRFAALNGSIPQVTQTLSTYLWNFHTTGTLGIGAGISAMPSLHIATVAWIALAFHCQRSRLAPLAILFSFYMWALSVALGWHYAIDGIVGAAIAVVSQMLCRAWLFTRQARPNPRGQPAQAA
jgi:hypothetical protein